MRATGGQGCSSKDDISQKEFHTSLEVVLFLRVYARKSMAEYPVANCKEPIKPLKIRPHAIKPIDIVLRRTTVTGVLPP